MNVIKNVIYLFCSILLVGVASFLIFLLIPNKYNEIFNSDALYLPVLLGDLFNHGGKLSDWHLTPAPYFFPDMPIYVLSMAFTNSLFYQYAIFYSIQAILTLLVFCYVLKTVSNEIWKGLAVFATLVVLYLSIESNGAYRYLLHSAYHYGAFLSSLLILGLWLRINANHSLPLRLTFVSIACIVSYFSALSDSLFLINSTIPLVLSILVLHGKNYKSNMFLLVAGFAISLSAFIGNLSYNFIVQNPVRYDIKFRPLRIFRNLDTLLPDFLNFYSQYPFLVGLFFIAFGIGCYLIFSHNFKNLVNDQRNDSFFIFYCISSIVVNIFVVLTVKLISTDRYLISFYIIPLLLLCYLFFRLFHNKYSFVFTLGGIFLISVQLFEVGNAKYNSHGFSNEYYPNYLECIDRAIVDHKLSNGVSQYWDAKLIQSLSKNSIRIAQYRIKNGLFIEDKWITSDLFYSKSYDFVLLNDQNNEPFPREDYFSIKYGSPSSVVKCDKYTLLVYKSLEFSSP